MSLYVCMCGYVHMFLSMHMYMTYTSIRLDTSLLYIYRHRVVYINMHLRTHVHIYIHTYLSIYFYVCVSSPVTKGTFIPNEERTIGMWYQERTPSWRTCEASRPKCPQAAVGSYWPKRCKWSDKDELWDIFASLSSPSLFLCLRLSVWFMHTNQHGRVNARPHSYTRPPADLSTV